MLSKLTKLSFFGSGIGLVLVGLLLCLDAFLPKEKPTSAATPFVEFLIGLVLFLGGTFLGRKYRFGKTTTVN
jgi:hypothetical protein